MNFLFSIITPLYKTPVHKIFRLYDSLSKQTNSNWEWIVYDDSPIEHKTCYNYIKRLSEKDKRIFLYTDKHSGIIGEVKRKACYLAKGDILVEVDHDDELINTCLENLSIAYSYSDEIGFVYGNCCEIFEDSEDILDYGDNWAYGYGNYRTEFYKDKKYKVAISANINPKTIRHITSSPNHVRSWRKDIYHKIGGHNKYLHVADDYELMVRTFLNTKMAKIDVFTYIQYFDSKKENNTQFTRNDDIQKIVYQTANFYNNKIHQRFLDLNIDDYVWNSNGFDIDIKNPEIEPFSNIIIPTNLLKQNTQTTDIYAYSRVYNIEHIIDYKKTEHYSNLIKWLIKLTNCQNYLELGVQFGENIKEISKNVKMCVGVDIIDGVKNKDNINFYNMSTSDFFSINENNFDIIFIDANHDFEEVKKDFNNSLKILNKYGIIIIHDTDPITEKLLDSKYCSDSYKIVDYISSHDNLNIINLPIQETGLTLVMRKDDRRVNNFLKK